MNENQISIEMSAADVTAVNAAFQTLATKLSPYLIALHPDDKRTLAALGERGISFVEKAMQYAQSNPEFMPAFIDAGEFKAEFKKDFDAFNMLRGFLRLLGQIHDNLNDTAALCGSEANKAALAYYGWARARQNKTCRTPKPSTKI